MMRSKFIGLVALAGAISVLAAGCGAWHPKSANSAGPQDIANKAFEFATCMRNHGVTNFPDPKVSNPAPGQTAVAMVVPSTLAKSPQLRSAARACRSILPPPNGGNPALIAKARLARKQDLLAFARCLRAHGLNNFPDPTSQGQLTLEMINNAGVDLHAPGVIPAARACIGLTHGLINMAAVERAVNGTT